MKQKRIKRERVPFRVRLARFMLGRNGPDALGRFIYLLLFITLIVSFFVSHIALHIAALVLVFLYFFRFLSKNRTRRAKENAWFLKVTRGSRQFLLRQGHRIRDRKTHVYRRCPLCKNHLRLPRRPGEHWVNCPACHAHFKVKIK